MHATKLYLPIFGLTARFNGFRRIVTTTQDQTQAYVTNINSNSVSVIDISTNTVIATIPVSGNPNVDAVTPDGTKVYVAAGAGGISVIDTSSNTVVTTISDNGASAVAITPNGTRAYVTNESANSVSVIDTSTNTVIATIPVGVNPFGVAIRPPLLAAQIQPPINADGSSVFNAKRGVVPVKLTLTSDGAPTCQLPPATISLARTAGAVLGSIDESVFAQSADTGSYFRIDSANCQYVYNLASKSLGPGTYLVQISINGVVVGSGTFGLK
jgi:YVTN family beta-propeller protein